MDSTVHSAESGPRSREATALAFYQHVCNSDRQCKQFLLCLIKRCSFTCGFCCLLKETQLLLLSQHNIQISTELQRQDLGFGVTKQRNGFDSLGLTDYKNLLLVMFLADKFSGLRGTSTE